MISFHISNYNILILKSTNKMTERINNYYTCTKSYKYIIVLLFCLLLLNYSRFPLCSNLAVSVDCSVPKACGSGCAPPVIRTIIGWHQNYNGYHKYQVLTKNYYMAAVNKISKTINKCHRNYNGCHKNYNDCQENFNVAHQNYSCGHWLNWLSSELKWICSNKQWSTQNYGYKFFFYLPRKNFFALELFG